MANDAYTAASKEDLRIRIRELEATNLEQARKILSYKARKDGAYTERNRVVALLSKLLVSSLGRHSLDDKEWDIEWRNIVYVALPNGKQLSWHIHDSHLPLFPHLQFNTSVQWDGHTTEEKYARIEAYVNGR